MPKMVIERSGEATTIEDVQADQEWCSRRMLELARACPPYLEEEPLTLTDHGLTEDGTKRRYTVRAVMNTDRGKRINLGR